MKTKNLYEFFGWQGGTIHQLEKATGVPADVLLAPKPDHINTYKGSKFDCGLSWATCKLDWRLSVLTPTYHGCVDYWLGVRDAI